MDHEDNTVSIFFVFLTTGCCMHLKFFQLFYSPLGVREMALLSGPSQMTLQVNQMMSLLILQHERRVRATGGCMRMRMSVSVRHDIHVICGNLPHANLGTCASASFALSERAWLGRGVVCKFGYVWHCGCHHGDCGCLGRFVYDLLARTGSTMLSMMYHGDNTVFVLFLFHTTSCCLFYF